MDLPDAPASDRPTLSRNLRFWLLTMLLGSLFVLLRLGTLSSNNEYLLAVLLITLGLATALSLAALPLLLPLLPWALGARSRGLRWLRLLTLQSAVLGLLVALDYAVLGGHPSRITLVVGATYFVAGLLAAPVVYAPWLGQPWPTR